MNPKLLRQAMEYSPEKLTEFLVECYSSLRIDAKAVLRAKFDAYYQSDVLHDISCNKG